MYIISSSCISSQPSFKNVGYSHEISEANNNGSLIEPNYSNWISPMDRRRMSDVLKMATTCALDCLQQTRIEQPKAIIVGTGLGCSQHTKIFLDKIATAEGGLISPTSFTLSTHNSISGQISLRLKNHSYNMTHTQNSLSLEHALIDAKLCLEEKMDPVLVGVADETESDLHNQNIRTPSFNFSSGAAFFALSNNKEKAIAKITDIKCNSLISEIKTELDKFLSINNLTTQDVDLVCYSAKTAENVELISTYFGNNKTIDFDKLAGTYYTNNGFGLDFLLDKEFKNQELKTKPKNVLLLNNLIKENLGLILINSIV